jgi:hypothetical protein
LGIFVKYEPEEETPYQLKPPINHLKRAGGQEVNNILNPKKSSG